jgi:hypothetical protein
MDTSAIPSYKTAALEGRDSDSEKGSNDQQDDAAIDQLDAFINNLPASSKRKAIHDNDENSEPIARKRIAIRDQTEAGLEGDYLPVGGMRFLIY